MGLGDWLSKQYSQVTDNKGGAIQEANKADVVGNALGLPHFGDARTYAPDRPGINPNGAQGAFRTNPDGSKTYVGSGQTFAADGTPVLNPNLAQQVGNTSGTAANFLNNATNYGQQAAAVQGQEGQLSNILNQQIAGTGPTVAGQQLAIGQDANARQQLAQAAGASGSGALLSRLAAQNNTAQSLAQTNQQQGLARTQEQQGAIGAQAGLLNGMANQSIGQQNTATSAGLNANQQAIGGQENIEDANSKIDQANAAASQAHKDSILNSFGGVASKFLSL